MFSWIVVAFPLAKTYSPCNLSSWLQSEYLSRYTYRALRYKKIYTCKLQQRICNTLYHDKVQDQVISRTPFWNHPFHYMRNLPYKWISQWILAEMRIFSANHTTYVRKQSPSPYLVFITTVHSSRCLKWHLVIIKIVMFASFNFPNVKCNI